jgi:hypothetical protein
MSRTVQELIEKLNENADLAEFRYFCIDECEGVEGQLPSLAETEAILRFMEEHPDLDYGMPGPLVRIVEQRFGDGYEDLLVDSINRRVTMHTLSMLNRITNGSQEPQRGAFIELIRGVAGSADLDEAIVAQAQYYLD